MMRSAAKYLACFCLITMHYWSFGQLSMNSIVYSTAKEEALEDTSSLLIIEDIIISGNNTTRPATILRELPFETGEEYPVGELVQHFKKARRQLMNTGLFREVTVSLKNTEGKNAFVHIEVLEKWYLWPKAFVKYLHARVLDVGMLSSKRGRIYSQS